MAKTFTVRSPSYYIGAESDESVDSDDSSETASQPPGSGESTQNGEQGPQSCSCGCSQCVAAAEIPDTFEASGREIQAIARMAVEEYRKQSDCMCGELTADVSSNPDEYAGGGYYADGGRSRPVGVFQAMDTVDRAEGRVRDVDDAQAELRARGVDGAENRPTGVLEALHTIEEARSTAENSTSSGENTYRPKGATGVNYAGMFGDEKPQSTERRSETGGYERPVGALQLIDQNEK